MPGDPATAEFCNKIKLGNAIHGEFTQMRNYDFHKKLFSLLNLAFEYWQPGEITSKYGKPEKNFDRFREDLTILAGYYYTQIRLDGSVRVVADSLSFGKMNQETFDKLYQNILTVVIEKILYKMTGAEIEKLADQVWSYA